MKLFASLNIFNPYSYESGIVIELLKKHQINVTGRTIDEALQQHPDYPSMLSMSDCLKKWNVNNAIVKVDPEKLSELPLPCVAHMKNNSFYHHRCRRAKPRTLHKRKRQIRLGDFRCPFF